MSFGGSCVLATKRTRLFGHPTWTYMYKLEITCLLCCYGPPGYVVKSVFLRSVAYVSRSGGMSNELNNIISRTTDGVYEGVAIGGDRYPGTTFMDHVMRYQENPDVKMIVVLGEVHFLLAVATVTFNVT